MAVPVRDLSRGVDPSLRRSAEHLARLVTAAYELLGDQLPQLAAALVYSYEFSPGPSSSDAPTAAGPASNPPPGLRITPSGAWSEPDRYAQLTKHAQAARAAMDALRNDIADLLRRNEAHRGREATVAACLGCGKPIGTTHERAKAGCCLPCYEWTRDENKRRDRDGLPRLDFPELIRRRRDNLEQRQEATG